MKNATKDAGMVIHDAWWEIQNAHEHTTKAQGVLPDAGLHKEYALVALRDFSNVRDSADDAIKNLAIHLVRDLNVAAVTVAKQAGVTSTTIGRWVNSED